MQVEYTCQSLCYRLSFADHYNMLVLLTNLSCAPTKRSDLQYSIYSAVMSTEIKKVCSILISVPSVATTVEACLSRAVKVSVKIRLLKILEKSR